LLVKPLETLRVHLPPFLLASSSHMGLIPSTNYLQIITLYLTSWMFVPRGSWSGLFKKEKIYQNSSTYIIMNLGWLTLPNLATAMFSSSHSFEGVTYPVSNASLRNLSARTISQNTYL
jgi:hypothetical protein